MSELSSEQAGYWAIATQKHLVKFQGDADNLDEFDSLSLAGRCGRLAAVLRGCTLVSDGQKLEKMAASVGIRRSELWEVVLPRLRAATKQIDVKYSSGGQFVRVEEYMTEKSEVLRIAGSVFDQTEPRPNERITVLTMDKTYNLPLTRTEAVDSLTKAGFREQDILTSFGLQKAFKLVEILEGAGLREPMLTNEYVWGPNHHKIAHALSCLDLGKRDRLGIALNAVQSVQGLPEEILPDSDPEVLLLAKKVGILDTTAIITAKAVQKAFLFSPHMWGGMPGARPRPDILDEVKLFLASIRFGERYSERSQIWGPEKLVNALVRDGEIGRRRPASAIGTDYTLLEKAGIVKVEHQVGDRYSMKLLKRDVAELALQIIRQGKLEIDEEGVPPAEGALGARGTFVYPEISRMELGKLPAPLAEAQNHLVKVLREETSF